MNRSTLWSLRDLVFDARRRRRLPDVFTVEDFIQYLEVLILVLPKLSAAQVWWFRKHNPDLKPLNALPMFGPLPTNDPDARELFAKLQDELGRIILRQYVIGSWSGLVFVAPRWREALRAVLQRRKSQNWPDLEEAGWVERDVAEESDVVEDVTKVIPHLRRRRDPEGKRRDLIQAAK